MAFHAQHNQHESLLLPYFTRIVAACVLILIFIGGMVKSTESGLAVPDWPLSYGMLFPPMVGGIFYEHGHRLAAAFVGFLIITQAILIQLKDKRLWMKRLAWSGVGIVLVQGLLGGVTVLLYLPTVVSSLHAVLAQTLFLWSLTVVYGFTSDFKTRDPYPRHAKLCKAWFFLIIGLYIQLILGAVMRHWEAALAVYDFPTTAGRILPWVDENTLNRINAWRFMHGHSMVQTHQVVAHLLHRWWGILLALVSLIILFPFYKSATSKTNKKSISPMAMDIHRYWMLMGLQITLGILIIITRRQPHITSLHVACGAAVLGAAWWGLMRSGPLGLHQFVNLWKTQ